MPRCDTVSDLPASHSPGAACNDLRMADNPRKDAFKRLILDTLRKSGPSHPVPKDELLDAARLQLPDLCDDTEPCYPGCDTGHPKWRHEFDRSIYDLTATRPPKIRPGPKRGSYVLNA
jgi:hypothetical protein